MARGVAGAGVPEGDAMIDHEHYYLLPPPSVDPCIGVCRVCGEEKEHSNLGYRERPRKERIQPPMLKGSYSRKQPSNGQYKQHPMRIKPQRH